MLVRACKRRATAYGCYGSGLGYCRCVRCVHTMVDTVLQGIYYSISRSHSTSLHLPSSSRRPLFPSRASKVPCSGEGSE